jgi:hypothetical protein
MCDKNKITKLPDLPRSLVHLNIAHNQCKVLPKLPPRLSVLYLSGNPLEDPFKQFLGKTYLSAEAIAPVLEITNNYWDLRTINTLGSLMVDPKSHLAAGIGKRPGYGFPVGPNALITNMLGITEGKESFNTARARLRTKVNPNPLVNVNSTLFKGGATTRKKRRSKVRRTQRV